MLLHLTEALRCPRDHDESFVVCVPTESVGADVVSGFLGCPVCRAEYPIAQGAAHFGRVKETIPVTPLPYDAAALEAFLGLEGRGGYVVLAGDAARHAEGLADKVPGVHLVAVNATVAVPPGVSAVVCPGVLPLRTRAVRAVALGQDMASASWIAEGLRVLLPGLRLVVEHPAGVPDGVDVLMEGGGVLVGQKRAG